MRRSRRARPRGSTAAWRSRTRTPPVPPIPAPRSKARVRSSSAPARIASPATDTVEPSHCGGRSIRAARSLPPAQRWAGAIVADLTAAGWKARIVADDNALVDRERPTAPASAGTARAPTSSCREGFVVRARLRSHRRAAARPPPPVDDGCGTCRRCIDGCPTGAIVAPGVVDARRCLAWLVQAPGVFPRELREALGDRLYGCDDCQEVCPPNLLAERPRRGASGGAGSRRARAPRGSDAELLERHGRWYIPDRAVRYLRRNALVVLGNTADGRRTPRSTPPFAAISRTPTSCCGLTRVGRAPGSTASTCSRSSPTIRARSSAPSCETSARHERLPAEARRHPVVPLGAVAAAATRRLRRPDDARGGGVRTGGPSRSASSATATVCCPDPALAQRIGRLAREVEAKLVVLDPALPLGLLGPRLSLPYGLVLHGAEVTVPGRLPVSQPVLRSVLRGAGS